MPGRIIRVMPRTLFNIGTAQTAGSQAVFVVAQNVDVSQFVYGQMLLRVHAFGPMAQGAGTAPKIQIDAYQSAPTEEDPATTFRNGTPIGALSVAYTYSGSGTDTGKLTVGSGTSSIMGTMLDIVVTIYQFGSTAGIFPISASADLSVKS